MPAYRKSKKITILGIDPGLANTGFGLIEKQGNSLTVLDYGCIKTQAKTLEGKRLLEINQALNELIEKYKPQIIAVEKLFFCKNVKTAIAVGQARGVVVLAAGQNSLDLVEFTPLQVKQALSGYGRASKKQIQAMVKVVLNLPQPPKSPDAADALAIAVCAANSLSKNIISKSYET